MLPNPVPTGPTLSGHFNRKYRELAVFPTLAPDGYVRGEDEQERKEDAESEAVAGLIQPLTTYS